MITVDSQLFNQNYRSALKESGDNDKVVNCDVLRTWSFVMSLYVEGNGMCNLKKLKQANKSIQAIESVCSILNSAHQTTPFSGYIL